MGNADRKAEITKSLRELTASYVANLNQCERVLWKLSQQLELDEPVSLRALIHAQHASAGPSRVPHHPEVDLATFCVLYRGRRCFLGNTLPFWLFGILAQEINRYVSYEQLLSDVWHTPKRSNEAIRNVAQILKRKLTRAGLHDLAAAIDGRNRGHYGLILDRAR